MDQRFQDKARIYWTPERLAKVTGGKKLLVTPDRAPLLLRTMNLLNADGSMSANDVRKFRQINHMAALMAPELERLSGQMKEVRILDVGCGNSYLTLLAAWLFHEHWHKPCQIIGIDTHEQRITASRDRAQMLGYQGFLKFHLLTAGSNAWQEAWRAGFGSQEGQESISSSGEVVPPVAVPRPNVVIALHACDTATDEALALGFAEKADFIAVAPCCQAELAATWTQLASSQHPMSPLFRSPHLRRETAAHITDMMRMLLMRSVGYEVTATEFVGLEHTPKNRLITCIRRGRYLKEAWDQFLEFKHSWSDTSIALEGMLEHLKADSNVGAAT